MLQGLDLRSSNSHSHTTNLFCYIKSNLSEFVSGGLFLEPTLPSSFVNLISSTSSSISVSGSASSCTCGPKPVVLRREKSVGFLSVSLKSDDGFVRESKVYLVQNREEGSEKATTREEGDAVVERGKKQKVRLRGGRAMNTTKHLWSGAIAAMVSR